MKIKVVIAVVWLLSAIGLKAQDTVNLSLQKAIDLGVQNSKQIKINNAKIEQAIAQFQQAKEARLPDVKISGSYLQLNHPDVKLKTDGSGSSGGSEIAKPSTAIYGMATVTLPVYSGSKIKNGIEAARYLQEAVKLDAEHDKEKIILNIINAYVNVYKAQESVKIVQENLRQSRLRDKDLSNMENNGLLARNDLLKAQLQTSDIELALVNAENNNRMSMVALNLITGLPERNTLRIDTAFLMTVQNLQALESYEQQALEKRKDLKSITFKKDAAVARTKMTKADYYPSLGLTGGYVAADIPKVLTVTNALNAGVGIQYNLGALWKTKSKVNEAKAVEKELSANEEMMADNIRLEINQAYENYLSAKKKLEVQQKAVINANENYRITKNKYNNSLVTTTELLDANTALLEASINAATAQADIFSAYSTLLEHAALLENNYINK